MKKGKLLTLAVLAIALVATAFTYSGEEKQAAKDGPGSNFLPRDPKTDHLLTSENTILLAIDWQQEMLGTVKNIDQGVFTSNI